MHALAERVVDLTVYLDRLGIDPPGPMPGRVAWHDPCHLRHHEGIVEAPRRLIRLVPGAELVESALESGCCGGAGAIILTQPELSDAILERRLAGFRAAGAETIITGSPSCVTQYRRAQNGLPVLYLSEYLERAYAAEGVGTRPAG
jgi:glycolate oxidase iron-sulfur subunit